MHEEPEIVLPSGPPDLPPSVPPPPLPPPKPWNGWMTLLWMLVTLGVWLGVQVVFTIVWVAGDVVLSGRSGAASLDASHLEALAFDGDFLGLATIIAALVACPLCYLIGRWCRGWSGMEYLALRKKPWVWSIILWSLATVLLGIGFNLMAPALGVDETPEFMRNAVQSSDFIPFMILGVVVGAPLVEEFIFRGVLFRGWRESKMGLGGTLVVTSLAWTLLHAGQYGLAILGFIFLLGLLMGYAREKTGSLWVPIAMHAVNNGIAVFETIRLAG